MQTAIARFPQVRARYIAPAADVHRRKVVCLPNEAARPTHKLCLRNAVELLGMPTGRALPRGVAGVNLGQGHSGPFGLIEAS